MATITLKGLAHSYLAQPGDPQTHPQDYAIQALDVVGPLWLRQVDTTEYYFRFAQSLTRRSII
jgi:hypothetical protein